MGEPSLLGDAVGPLVVPQPGDTARGNVTIEVVGEPVLDHEGGMSNESYLQLLQARHAQVKADIEAEGINITFEYDTYFTYNGIGANVLLADSPRIRNITNVADVHQRPGWEVQLDSSVASIRANPPANVPPDADGEGVVIAVLDTGIDASHPFLDDLDDDPGTSDPKVIAFRDFVNGFPNPYDDNGHGTHVAAIAAGTGEGTAYRGVAPGAKLAAVKVCNELGSCPYVEAGLDWVIQEKNTYGIEIVSMSIGARFTGDGESLTALEAQVRRAVSAGLIVVISAGNAVAAADGSGVVFFQNRYQTVSSPGSSLDAITVGAFDDRDDTILGNDELAELSCWGPTVNSHLKPDVVAPGVDVTSAWPGGGVLTLSGTSMAAPHVSGVAALLLERHPGWGPTEVKAAIVNYARALDPPPPFAEADKVYASGSGSVDGKDAYDPEAIMYQTARPTATTLSFGNYILNDAVWQKTQYGTLRDLRTTGGPMPYFFSLDTPDIDAQPGLRVEVNPSSPSYLELNPGQTGVFSVTMTVADPSQVPDGRYGGFVRASSVSESLKLPLFFVVERPALHLEVSKARDGNLVFFRSVVRPASLTVEVSGPGWPLSSVTMSAYYLQASKWESVSELLLPPPTAMSGTVTVTLALTDPDGVSDAHIRVFDYETPPSGGVPLRVQGGDASVTLVARPVRAVSTGMMDDRQVRYGFDNCADVGCDYEPATAGDSVGRFYHLAWVRYFLDPNAGWRSGVMYKRSPDFGQTWEPERFLLPLSWNGYRSLEIAVAGSHVYVTVVEATPCAPCLKRIMFLASDTRGETWRTPLVVSETPGNNRYLGIAAEGPFVHLVWEAQLQGVRYRRSAQYGLLGTWEDGRGVDQDRHLTDLMAEAPSITARGSEVHVVWAAFPTGIDHVRSQDRGANWQGPSPISAQGYYPQIAASGSSLHLSFTVWQSLASQYAAYMRSDDGQSWHNGMFQPGHRPVSPVLGVGGVRRTEILASSDTVIVSWAERHLQYSWSYGWRIAYAQSTDGGAGWNVASVASDLRVRFDNQATLPDVFSPGFGWTRGPSLAVDSMGGIHFVWSEFFGIDWRFFWYTEPLYGIGSTIIYDALIASASVHVRAPDGRLEGYTLLPGPTGWQASVPLRMEGLHNAEVLMHNEFQFLMVGHTNFGYVEFATGGGQLTEYLYVHKDAQFNEAQFALAGLDDFSAKPERTDQLNDATLDLFAYRFFHGHRQAQSIRPTSIRLSSADLLLQRTEGFASDVIVEVQTDDNGLPSGEVLTSVLISKADIPTAAAAWVHADFPDILTSDASYHLVARAYPEPDPCTDPFQPCEQFFWWPSGDSLDDPYVRGDSLWYLSGAWSVGAGTDRRFVTWSTALGPELVDQENAANPPPPMIQPWTQEATGQRFQPAAHTVASVDLRIARSTDFPFDLFVEIVNNGPGDLPDLSSPVARAYLRNGDIPTGFAWVHVDFANAVVVPGMKYHLVVRPGGLGGCPPNPPYGCYYMWDVSTDLYPGGEASRMVNGQWQQFGGDRLFKVSAADRDADLPDQTTGASYDISTPLSWGSEPIAQSFQPSSYVLSQIDLYLVRSSDLNWNLAVKVVRDNGFGLPSELPNDVLARETLVPGTTPGTILTTPSWVSLYLEDVRVDPSQSYHIVAEPTMSGALDPQGFVWWYGNSQDEYARGRASYRSGTWQGIDQWDRLFVSYTSDRASETNDQELDFPFVVPQTVALLGQSTLALAQGFVPAAEVVSSAKLQLARSGPDMVTDLLVEVQGTLANGQPNGIVKTRATLDADLIPVSPAQSFVTVDFSDYAKAPGERLALVLTSRLPVLDPQWVAWSLVSRDDYYVPGSAWSFSGPMWSGLAGDFQFHVLGVDTGPTAADQSQLAATAGASLGIADTFAQSFRPARPILTDLRLTLDNPSPSIGEEVVVEIQTDVGGVPDGVPLLRTAIPSGSLPSGISTVTVSIPDLAVDTSKRYFLVLRLSWPGDVKWRWHEASADGWRDAYVVGTASRWNGAAWELLELDDLAFETFGKGYARLTTNPSVVLDPTIVNYLVWSHAGEFYGPDLSFDSLAFAQNLNVYVQFFGQVDELDYILVPVVFSSDSAGRLFVWGWKLS